MMVTTPGPYFNLCEPRLLLCRCHVDCLLVVVGQRTHEQTADPTQIESLQLFVS